MPINRLIHAEGSYGAIDYTYDNVGNRLTQTIGGSATSYTYYPDMNRLHEAVTGAETFTHTFDPNGNITGYGAKVLTYNQDNRLIRVEESGSTLGEYIYNGSGQRVIKNAGGVTTVFLYDFDGNIIGESDSSGNISKEYLYKGSSQLAMVDVLTGKQIMTDSTNTVVWEADYKPFGEADVNPNSTVVNNFRFPGQYYDAETGLHYNYHRYYDPSTGRYVTADPIGQDGGINVFTYVENNPINFFDQLGYFKAGGPKASFPGHSDFSGGNYFNYNLEDTDPRTKPITGDSERHFRDLPISERDVANAINSCDEDAFQRAMHRGQDYFSHYRKGFRWQPGRWTKGLGLGHLFPIIGPSPDNDREAWKAAEKWTQYHLNKWNEKCGCKK